MKVEAVPQVAVRLHVQAAGRTVVCFTVAEADARILKQNRLLRGELQSGYKPSLEDDDDEDAPDETAPAPKARPRRKAKAKAKA